MASESFRTTTASREKSLHWAKLCNRPLLKSPWRLCSDHSSFSVSTWVVLEEMTEVSQVSHAQCCIGSDTQHPAQLTSADQLKVVPDRTRCTHLWQLLQPCRWQAHPGWIHGGRGKCSKLFYFLAWAAEWGSAHTVAAGILSSFSGVPDVHSAAKDVVLIWVIAV